MDVFSFIIILVLDLLAIVALFSLPPALIYFIFKRRTPTRLKEWISIIIAGICLLILSFSLGFYDTAGDEHIVVNKPLSTKLSNYYKVLLEETPDLNKDYSPLQFLENKSLKVSETINEFNPDLRVVVSSEMGLMPPTFIGHTPVPSFKKGLSRLTYTFINHKSNEIIGEVKYNRPFYKIKGLYIAELMFQKITEFKPGLTDFTEWSKVTMDEPKIRIELPKDFHDYSVVCNRDNSWFRVDIEMHKFFDAYSHGVAESQMGITFKKDTKEEFISDIKRELKYTSAKLRDSKQKKWETSFHSSFTKSENLEYNDFQYEYRKDYEVAGGYVIRAHATRSKNIPNSSIVEDEKAIRRIMESLEILGQDE
ncbi:hypothetical protein ACFL2O_09200 [Thermodesulfobacteriota bacterium]